MGSEFRPDSVTTWASHLTSLGDLICDIDLIILVLPPRAVIWRQSALKYLNINVRAIGFWS